MNAPITLKQLANLLGIALLIAVVVPFVVYAVPAVVGAEYSFVVLTASMTPAIAPGDVVIVDERDPAAIAEGDVITFVRGDGETPVTHRVIGVETAGGEFAFETQGDANEGPDPALVPAANVIGAVAFTIPYIGYVIQFTDSPIGFALLVVAPFGLLALTEVWSLYRSRTRGAEGSDAADPDVVDVDAGAAEATDSVTDDSAADSGFVVTKRTVEGAVAVLLFFVPYAGYVAYTLRTALAIAVAVGTGMTLLMAAVLLVTDDTGDESSDATSAPDDGGDTGRDVDGAADAPVGGNGDAGDDLGDTDVGEDDRVDEPRGTDDGTPAGIFERPVITPATDGGSGGVDGSVETADEEGR